MEITDNHGADAVLECVGTEQSVDTATKVGRPGAIVGRVGIRKILKWIPTRCLE